MFITLLPSYVAPRYSYVTSVFVYNLCITLCVCMYSYVTHMLLVCSRMLLVCTRILLVCTRMLLVCHSYVTRMYSYVTRRYSCGASVTILLTPFFTNAGRFFVTVSLFFSYSNQFHNLKHEIDLILSVRAG